MDPTCLFDSDIDEVLSASQYAGKMEVGLGAVEKDGWMVKEEEGDATSSEGEALVSVSSSGGVVEALTVFAESTLQGEGKDRKRHEEEARRTRHSGG